MTNYFDFEMESLDGGRVSFSDYEGRATLVVNVASN